MHVLESDRDHPRSATAMNDSYPMLPDALRCKTCNTELASAGETRCPSCGSVMKGALLACVYPPFEPFGRYRGIWWFFVGAAVLVVLLLLLSVLLPSPVLTGCLFLSLFPIGLVLLSGATFLLTSVRIYENGMEMDIVRSGNKSLFLSWDRMSDYQFEGDIFHFAWQENGLTVLADGSAPAAWPYFNFPRKLRVPDARVEGVLRDALTPYSRS
jgi:hypothetical protein